jgi:transcriptional regulator with XRE-family HTH domain
MWTQADLSAVVDMDENQISRLENGTNAPNLHTIVALAVALGKHPSDLLKIDYKFELNDDFSTRHKKQKGPDTTLTVRRLLDSHFFTIPRTVADVILYCKREYKIVLKSSATAGVLKKLKDQKLLKRSPSPVTGRFVYHK